MIRQLQLLTATPTALPRNCNCDRMPKLVLQLEARGNVLSHFECKKQRERM